MPGFNYTPSDSNCGNNGGFSNDSTIGINEARKLPSPTVEPLRKYRFLFQILTIDQGDSQPLRQPEILSLYLESCDRPSLEIDTIVIHNGQTEIKRPGKSRWKPIKMNVNEVIDDSGIVTMEFIKRWYEEVMINNKYGVLNRAADIHKTCQITMEDGVGYPVWIYKLYNCWISNISPSSLSYSANEISTTEIELSYDRAFAEKGQNPAFDLLL